MREPWDDDRSERGPSREPLFRAPPVSLWLIAGLGLAYAMQVFLMTPDEVLSAALSSGALREGRWWTLISHIFLHGGLTHLLMNSGAALAFGPAVARHFGVGVRPAAVFLLFFLVCGVAGGLGFVAMHPTGLDPVVGASGAISGLWGGAARLLGRREGLWRVWEGPVRGQIIVVIALNLLIGLAGFAGEAAGVSVRIAWEAHIAGFVAGLFLVGMFARLARASDHPGH
ncbi:MAG: rhomboid family intramembrane serine protease [Caulobacter sp.]|nr:rhomboid family intramembrane serine protease [Caulobacter sp.]